MTRQDSMRLTFLHEADDLLHRVEQLVLDCERTDAGREPVIGLFRTFHTLKGAAGAAGESELAAFAHHVESLLDAVRHERISMSRAIVDVVLAATDAMQAMLAPIAGGPAPDPRQRERVATAIAQLLPAAGPKDAPTPGAARGLEFFEDAPAADASAGGQENGVAEVSVDAPVVAWSIAFTPDSTLFQRGVDPADVLDALRAIGECTVTALVDAVPALPDLEPLRCALRWRIVLHTSASADAVRDVFAFVENDSEIAMAPMSGEESSAPVPQTTSVAAPGPAVTPPAELTLPSRGEDRGERPAHGEGVATVRVPADRLDRLVKLVGELVILRSRVAQVAQSSHAPELLVPLEELERSVADLRDTVLGLRMLPIGATFRRFRRLVRDLSLELGKEVELATDGEETELDKTMLDQIAEPLVHLIRNALDHGFETPSERTAAGKPPRGTLRLSAVHADGHVVVAVDDDGRGLDDDKIRAKAERLGMVSAGTKLSRADLHDLVFLPGFSTASSVTEVSGRGVGMDVVRRQVEQLRGTVTLYSERGTGTCVAMTLPLTLAIIDGLLVEVGGERMVVPLRAVTESVEIGRGERAGNGRNCIAVRGELVPFLDLAHAFGFPSHATGSQRVVIVEFGRQRLGLLVDRILGVHQAVIQSLRTAAVRLPAVSGATILGDGRVALILDLKGLVESCHGTGEHPARVPAASKDAAAPTFATADSLASS